jgi:hypothetical protein
VVRHRLTAARAAPLKLKLTLTLTLTMTLAAGACGGSRPSLGANLSVFHLKVGECLVPPKNIQAELSSVKVVACREPHTQEVFAVIQDNTSSDNYPGDQVLRSFADGQCLQQFRGYVGVDYRQSSLYYTYLLPSVRSWSAGDRTVVCVITTTGQQMTSSVKGSKR